MREDATAYQPFTKNFDFEILHRNKSRTVAIAIRGRMG